MSRGKTITRLFNQITEMLTNSPATEHVVYSFVRPSSQQISFWMRQLGENYDKIKWVYGPEGLKQWLETFSNL